jgi:hypothetical protein
MKGTKILNPPLTWEGAKVLLQHMHPHDPNGYRRLVRPIEYQNFLRGYCRVKQLGQFEVLPTGEWTTAPVGFHM